MEQKEFLNMNEGDEELSYSQNAFLQKEVFLMSQSILESAIKSLIAEGEGDGGPCKVLKVADLGCGVGPVPLGLASLVKENVVRKCKKLKWEDEIEDDKYPEIEIYYNDLPSNDFNLLFSELMSLEEPERKMGVPLCFMMGVPGSFYGRLFPRSSLHLFHANYALHCLSQAPLGLYSQDGKSINKGNIYISETSPTVVAKAYLAQFEQDFNCFLKCRSKEVVANGFMLLTLRGRPSSSDGETWQPWELQILTHSIACLVSQGMIEEEKLDSFDFPCFSACKEEIQGVVESEGSFRIENTKAVTHPVSHEIEDNWKRAHMIGKFIRAFSKPLISRHFGHQVVAPLYDKVTFLTFQHLANHEPVDHYTIIILLRRN